MIENIPTSTIRGLSMGLVELAGKTRIKTPLKSPLTKTDCVLYMYNIEEYRRSGKHGHWVTIAKGDSFFSPFLLTDATGTAMVFPKGAEVIMPVDYEFTTGLFAPLTPFLTEFMDCNKIQYKSWIGTRALRFREWHVKEGEPIYVLGSAKSPYEISNKIPEKDPIDAIIAKGSAEKVFIISDHSEKSLLRSLSWQSVLGIFGGAVLSVVMLAYLLFRFNILKF